MNILFASWEMDPLIKRGGLGDVASSLPAALNGMGVDVRVVIPFYKAVKLHKARKVCVGNIHVMYGGRRESVEIFHIRHPESSVPVYLLKNTTYLDIPKAPDTFPFFNLAIIHMLKTHVLDWQLDILHCNDHHTGFLPLLLKEEKLPVKSMITLHNLLYQGAVPLTVFEKMGYPQLMSKIKRWEDADGTCRMLAEGIIHADVITTVSPTYAKEITTAKFGMGVEEILRGKEARLVGILNGIQNHWKNTRYVKKPEVSGWEETKRKNKLFLQRKLRLRVSSSTAILAFIGRIVPDQKGVDILYEMLQGRDKFPYEVIILGSGNNAWENKFQWLSTFYPKSIATRLVFDDVLAHQIYAGADFILIPSRFEPCGLIQMIAMEFGALPIAHKTGGLADSIDDGANGILFDTYSAKSLENAVDKALDIWKNRPKTYGKMVENALQTNFSWVRSAGKYRELYEKLLSGAL